MHILSKLEDLFFFIILPIGVILVIFGTLTQSGKFGIRMSSEPLLCPQCKTKLPSVRTPSDSSEALWGGSTCPQCKAKVDKWGKLRA